MPRITDAELTIYLDDGGQITIDPTPTKLMAMMRSCGYMVHEVTTEDDRSFYSLYSMDDKTIEERILPRLPDFS